MQFYEQNIPNANLITAIDDNGIYIKEQLIDYSAFIDADHVQPWHPKKTDFIDIEDLTDAITMKPMTIILGSNAPDLIHWVSPHIHTAIVQLGIGVEIMRVQSACHTYNLLTNEGRKTVLGVFFHK